VFREFPLPAGSIIASLYCEFLPENRPSCPQGFPRLSLRCKTAGRHFVRVIPLPVTGGPALSGLIEITSWQ
jgi:hypothetical protein